MAARRIWRDVENVVWYYITHLQAEINIDTAGWAFGFLRVKFFSRTHYLRFFPETSGIDVTLLGALNDIWGIRSANGNMPN